MARRAYLVLADGTVFEGYGFGAEGEVIGETVFTTGMTGYLETLTDKSYYGQIITQTFPLIGNYGVIPEDFESAEPAAKGYIVRQWCQDPSNFRSEGVLDAFLRSHGVVGLYGIDTRRLTKILRESGVMNGLITPTKPVGVPDAVKSFVIRDSVKNCSVRSEYTENPEGTLKAALIDYGLKNNIVRELARRGCAVTVLPYDTPPERILALAPDGIMLSNGPGDPRAEENAPIISNLKRIIEFNIPIFGICFGNQLLALAHGFEIEKLKYGHRGANQPAKDLTTGKTYITSQNHGYAVVSRSIDARVGTEWFVNVNDGTNEGVIYKNAPIRSVQFHPEACSGPRDASWLFDDFIARMTGMKGGRGGNAS
ncbi:MAG: carbamoyl phosphate synthase small subunit [Oscillospiraceae bacterium]|jgi:carbamoyl-phosphate synthase small subunit|nr:carbamoyl phosphate synthase small subunit [Oscillospiraceae bacterium]